MEKEKNIKIIETSLAWTLLFYLIINIGAFLKYVDTFIKFFKNINLYASTKDILYKLSNFNDELFSIYQLIIIYKTFLIILIVILFVFVVYRIITKNYLKLLKFNMVIVINLIIFSVIFSFILNRIQKIIKLIIENNYMNNLKNLYYAENIMNMYKMIGIVFIILFILSLIGFISNIYESIIITDKIKYLKLNIFVLLVGIILSIYISNKIYTKYDEYHSINIKRAIITEYKYNKITKTIDKKLKLMIKPLYTQVLNDEARLYLENKINYINESNSTNRILNIKEIFTKYEMKDYGYKINYNSNFINKFKINNYYVYVLDKPTQLDLDTTLKLMIKYDLRFINHYENKEYDKYYYNKNNNIYYSYRIKNSKLDYNYIEKNKLNADDYSYILINLGNIYTNNKNETLYYDNINEKEYSIFNSEEELDKYINKNDLKKLDIEYKNY